MKNLTTLILLLQGLATAVHAEWTLVWSDEFDVDGAPNSTYWTVQEGYLGVDNEFQTFANRPENILVQGGSLRISTIKDATAQLGYTSAQLITQSKVLPKYGRIEASIKIPDLKLGLSTAFSTRGQDYSQVEWPQPGGIDIMRMGEKSASQKQTLLNRRVVSEWHWDFQGLPQLEDAIRDHPFYLNGTFHTYTLEWTPEVISTFLDDFWIGSVSNMNCEARGCQEFHQPHFLMLGMAVGGNFACCDFGSELDVEPQGSTWTMEVDYIRVYGNEQSELFGANGTILTGQAAPLPTSAAPTDPPISVAQTASPTVSPTDRPTSTLIMTMDEPSDTLAPSETSLAGEQEQEPMVVWATGSPSEAVTDTPTLRPTVAPSFAPTISPKPFSGVVEREPTSAVNLLGEEEWNGLTKSPTVTEYVITKAQSGTSKPSAFPLSSFVVTGLSVVFFAFYY